MTKAHSPITWKNEPSVETPLNAANLNKMDNAIGVIDDRVILLDSTKANFTDISSLIASVSFNESTGIFTFTRKNGSSFTLDTKLEKLAVNFKYDQEKEQLVITLSDGTIQYVDISSLVRLQEFVDSSTIAWTVTGTTVTATIKGNSITEDMLERKFLSEIKTSVDSAANSATIASESAKASDESEANALEYAKRAEDAESSSNEILEITREIRDEINNIVQGATFTLNPETGNLEYSSPKYLFVINTETGNLEYEVEVA